MTRAAVAERIGIPHYVLDYESRFKEAVIDRFAESYIHGETPVPCVDCNMSIKFRDLLITARELGAEVLATGPLCRFARLCLMAGARSIARATRSAIKVIFSLAPRASNSTSCVFRSANERRRRRANSRAASALRSPTSTTARTSVSCRSGHYADIIERLKPGAAEAGDIVDLDGKVLGAHSGIIHFTVGQRRGLGVATGTPLYVVRLDAESRRVVVGPREALRMSRIVLRDVNWIGDGAS